MASRLHRETCRLDTFRTWKLSFIRPKELARYGFYYTGIANLVKCNFCLLENNVWEPGDDILFLHLNRSPECTLFTNRASNNVPIDNVFRDYYLDDLSFPGEYGIDRTVESAHTVYDDYFTAMTQLNNVTLENQTTVQSSAYPRYAAEADRLSSFQHWPTSVHQKPQQLSDAGFFYTGSGDRVLCFSCGGGLMEWQKKDEPWEQHAFWHSKCKYLALQKGLKFIKTCEKMYVDGYCVHSQPCTSGFEPAVRCKIGRMVANISISESRLHEDLNREICRLGTFTSSWPVSFINPSELARYGFFYTGIADAVKCYFCHVGVGMWEEQDNVITEHLRWSPRCPLLRKRTTNNVPINQNFLDNVPDPDGDVCGSNMHRFYNAMTSVQRNNYTEDIQRSFQRLAHPSYAIDANRLSSFKSWPKSIHQKPQQLSDAGFFYTGFGDHVECFSCGVGLNNWEPEDEPWEEHAKYHSTCEYLKLMKNRSLRKTCKRIADNPDPGTSGLRLPTELTSHWTPSGVPECSPTLEGDRQGDEKVTKDEKLCKICFVNEYNTVFLPCGHVVACAKCALAVTKCPLCQKRHTDIRRVYLS